MATQRRWKNPNELVKMKKKKVERNDTMGHITLQLLQPAVPSSSLAAKRPLEEQSTAIVKVFHIIVLIAATFTCSFHRD